MSDTLVVKTTESESEALSDLPDSSSAMIESPDNLKTATSSSHHDSEYDTASDTSSDLDNDNEDDFEDDDHDDNGEYADQQEGDGGDDAEKKKVDDDEDRSNPQYIPKRGVFYEHDDRTAEEPDTERKPDEEGAEEKIDSPTPVAKKPSKKSVTSDRWSHDRYNENEQAPKSRAELVNSYGYDIRNEDGPPRALRRRRYGRGPNKYNRSWEDEKAYTKASSQQVKIQRNQSDFPELNSRRSKHNLKEEKENKNDENRKHSNKSPNQRSHYQQQFQQQDQRSHSDRYEGNRTLNEKFEGNREQIERFEGTRSENDRYDRSNQQYNERYESEKNRSFNDSNRSQNSDGRSHNDRFDGNRTKFFENNRSQGDRYDGNRQQHDQFEGHRSNNRFDGNSRYSNDQYDRNQNDRHDKRMSDKFDGNRDRYDQRTDRGSGDKERSWERRSGKANDSRNGSGFRTGKNTIEFKNQNRNKPFDSVNNTTNVQTSKGYASGFSQRSGPVAEYETDMPVESVSFTNSKMSNSTPERYSNTDYNQIETSRHRVTNETDRPERPITGRQLGSSTSRGPNVGQQPPLPIATSIHNQQSSINIQQQLPTQTVQQQQNILPQQQQNANMLSNEARSAKRYSTLRQRTSDAVQSLSIPQQSLSLHDLHEQQILLQDMMQMQNQEHLQSNLAHQPPLSNNYSTQQIPMQMPNDYATHGQKSQTTSQSNQQAIMQPTAQSQSNNQSAQYQSTYFAPNEFAAQSVVPPSSTPIQPASQPSQQILSTQYSTQYPQQQNAPYVQPPPQTSYIQPAVNQQQQLMNYVPAIPPAQQQFPAVQSFPSYPTVPNYNSVPSGITQSGITYYPPQSQPRPILSQRRPTNAIPILPPSERFGKGRIRPNSNQFEEDEKTSLNPPIGSPENIDHILDNMFTQRPPFQPPTRKSNSPSPESNTKSNDGQIDSPQSIVSSQTFDNGSKQIDFSDVPIVQVNLEELTKQIENADGLETTTS